MFLLAAIYRLIFAAFHEESDYIMLTDFKEKLKYLEVS